MGWDDRLINKYTILHQVLQVSQLTVIKTVVCWQYNNSIQNLPRFTIKHHYYTSQYIINIRPSYWGISFCSRAHSFCFFLKENLESIFLVYVECIPIQGTPKQSVLPKFLFFWKGDLKGSSITISSPYISVIVLLSMLINSITTGISWYSVSQYILIIQGNNSSSR